MHEKNPSDNSGKRRSSAGQAESKKGHPEGRGAAAKHSASGADGTAEQMASDDQDLLLWALANGLEPEGGWFRTLKLSRRELDALASQHRPRFEQLKRMEVIGRLLFADQLAVLLKARLAQMLLAASGPKELVEAVRVYEKLPAAPVPAARDATDGDALDLELDEGELRETMDEARRLLKELEADPAVRRLLGPAAGNGEEPQC